MQFLAFIVIHFEELLLYNQNIINNRNRSDSMKRMLAIAMTAALSMTLLAGCQKEEEALTTVTINEVTHSV